MAEDEKKEKQLERQLVRVGVIARLSDTGVNWIQELTHEGVIESLPAEKGTGRVYDLFPTS